MEGDRSVVTLGEKANPSVYWMEALWEVEKEAQKFARYFSGSMPRHVAKYQWDMVFASRVVYRLLFATVDEQQLDAAVRPAYGAFKKAMGMESSTATSVVKAMGLGELWHKLNIDRLLTLFRCLTSTREYLRLAARAGLYREAKWEGSRAGIPGMEHCEPRGWSGTWIGAVRRWMKSVNVLVVGGEGLRCLREGDEVITELACNEEERYVLAAGSWILEVWRLSEMLTMRGRLHSDMTNGKWRQQLRQKMEGGVDQADEWIRLVTTGVQQWRRSGGELGRWFRQGVRCLASVVWWDGEVQELRMGMTRLMEDKATWDDVVTIEVWEAVEGFQQTWGGMFKHYQLWRCKGEQVMKRAGELWPVHVREVTGEMDGCMWSGVMIDEDEEVVEHWMQCGFTVCEATRTEEEGWRELEGWEQAAGHWSSGKVAEVAVVEEWDFEGKEELVGWGVNMETVCRMWEELYDEAESIERRGGCVRLISFSDGSMKGEGMAKTGSYGWMIRGIAGGVKRDELWGGGVMRGDPLHLQSTRCENVGVLAVMIGVVEIGLLTGKMWRWEWTHMLDNKGVVSRLERAVGWGREEEEIAEAAYSFKTWVAVVDLDISTEMEAWMGRCMVEPQCEWRRGHPERRQKDRSRWSDEEACIFRVDAIAEWQYMTLLGPMISRPAKTAV